MERYLVLTRLMFVLAAGACLLSNPAIARRSVDQGSDISGLHTGREIYDAACVACHGADGAGAPQSMTGFQKPATFPDFTQCDQTAPEYWRDWKAVIRDGGPARGFSQIMPAFGDVFTPEQIDQLAQYLRSLCSQQDPAFDAQGHRVRYSLSVDSAAGPFRVEAELWYQPIGFRWANNLRRYDSAEPHRFNSYFDSMSAGSAVVLARACSPAPCVSANGAASP